MHGSYGSYKNKPGTRFEESLFYRNKHTLTKYSVCMIKVVFRKTINFTIVKKIIVKKKSIDIQARILTEDQKNPD